MQYLHDKNVAHRDLKLENLIVTDSHKVSLIDFGFSICGGADKKLKIFCGTPNYMAPEIVEKKTYYGPQADIWALGILTFVLLFGRFPFRGISERDLYRRISQGKF